ncbi:glycosyltransferase family 2 protein [Butyrivibrio proteoclasticus]|uniref:glycosyltransferase family 2 protein n=1 Tax=Butyrivibrio proteoclasticus TaxID=43305 RepID=UPI000ADA7FF9|nr:glycosyltransferase family 2 protein [Butyrivibrio proteoclasticus]
MRKISVITVTKNCQKTIERTIKSVLAQENEEYEYIIIDGASTDGTVDIIKKYSDKLSFWVSEPDLGIYDAMNKGIRKSTGDLAFFLNGDDYLLNKNTLEHVRREYEGDNTILIGRVRYGNKVSEIYSDVTPKSMYYDIFYPHQATFIPKYVFDKIGLYSLEYHISGDFEWICRAISSGFRLKWIDYEISEFSLGGLSSSLQCIIDEYNISSKYMVLTNDMYLKDMKNKSIEKGKTYFFRYVLRGLEYVKPAREILLDIGIEAGNTIQIWGAGFWADLFISFFRNCDIFVDNVFDSNSDKRKILGVPVTKYSKNKTNMIVVSTELYDEEISQKLIDEGFMEGRDFVSFHKLRDKMIQIFDTKNEDYQHFVSSTGLELLKK